MRFSIDQFIVHFIVQFIVPNLKKRLAFMIPAVILMGVFVSILIEIGWGTDPASFMNLNIAKAIGWNLGNTEVLVYGIMLVFTLIFGSDMIGFGTLANMILIGYVVDLCRILWNKTGFSNFITQASFPVTLILFILTLFLFVIVASIYINSQIGVAPYDAIPNIISRWLPEVPFFIIRILFDFAAVGAGVLAGKLSGGIEGSVIGSIAMSILLGPVISLVGKPLKKIL